MVVAMLLRRREFLALGVFLFALYALVVLLFISAHLGPDETMPELLPITPTAEPNPRQPPDWAIANRVLQSGAAVVAAILVLMLLRA